MCFSISSSLGSTFENKCICLSGIPQHGNTLQFLVFKNFVKCFNYEIWSCCNNMASQGESEHRFNMLSQSTDLRVK